MVIGPKLPVSLIIMVLHISGLRLILLSQRVKTSLFYRIKGPNKGFLKPFLKGKILRSSERGVNSILTTILRF